MDCSQTSWNRLHEIVCWVVCSDYSVAYVCPPAGPWRTWLLSGFVLLLIPQMIFCKVGATVWRENFFKAPAAVTFLHLTPLCYVLVWSKPTSTAGTGSIWLHLPYSSSNPPALSRNSFWVCQRLERRGRCVLNPRAQSHRRPRSVVFLMCGNKKSITMENKRSIYPLWVTEDVWVTDEIFFGLSDCKWEQLGPVYLSESALICWHFVTDELVGVGLFQLKWRFQSHHRRWKWKGQGEWRAELVWIHLGKKEIQRRQIGKKKENFDGETMDP